MQRDLAALSGKHWRWQPGMSSLELRPDLLGVRWRCCGLPGDGEPATWVAEGSALKRPQQPSEYPDLDDPANAGPLLAAALRLWREHQAKIESLLGDNDERWDSMADDRLQALYPDPPGLGISELVGDDNALFAHFGGQEHVGTETECAAWLLVQVARWVDGLPEEFKC